MVLVLVFEAVRVWVVVPADPTVAMAAAVAQVVLLETVELVA